MSKKILLVGHRGGLGSFLSKNLVHKGYVVTGRSRETGHDLLLREGRHKLLQESLNVDVVIINSRAQFGQVEFLLDLHEEWVRAKHHKHVITIGSRASVDYLTRTHRVMRYDYQKIALEKASETLSLLPDIRVSHLNIDYLETPNIMKKKELMNQPKLPLGSVGDILNYMIEAPKGVLIAKMNVWAY